MRVSIVIPSLNQGRFLESTITSLIGQHGPEVEIIVMDAGSTDDSVSVIERYSDRIAYWRSHPDKGQAAAINEGFGRATGDVFAWLNSDDFLLPGALECVAKILQPPERQILVGNCFHFREASAQGWGSDIEKSLRARHLRWSGFFLQPSSFWTRAAWDATGPLDESLHFVFDWDWFLRVSRVAEVRATPNYLSAYRRHEGHKTGSGGQRRLEEIHEIYRRYGDSETVRAVREIERLGEITDDLERWLCRLRLRYVRPKILGLLFPAIYKTLPLSAVSQIREQLRS